MPHRRLFGHGDHAVSIGERCHIDRQFLETPFPLGPFTTALRLHMNRPLTSLPACP
jgi:hypothetical protein